MRSEWVPLSAAALVTGVMALVLGQMLNPGGSDARPADQLILAAEHAGQWLAMSLLFFGGAAALILGLPAVAILFTERRGRGLGMFGVAVFAVGCVGVGAVAALMLMFRALALESQETEAVVGTEIRLVTAALDEPALQVSLSVWVYAFIAGVGLIAVALFRTRRTARWVPWLLMAFLATQLLMPFIGDGAIARVVSGAALMLLAAGFTGIATQATSPRSHVPVTHTLVRS